MIKIYGIKNCDTMKKAFTALDAAGVPYQFHDYKTLGITEAQLRTWLARTSWEALLNTRGTTWRALSDADRVGINEARAIALMIAKPSLIKRPVIESGTALIIGFDAARMAALKEAVQ